MDIKYIDDDKQNGILYDYGKIRKALKRKKVYVPDAFNPCEEPIEKSSWFIGLSERGIGKTTGWLLFGIEMFLQYGTVIQYVRDNEDQIMPKNSKDIFKVILENDYISKMTGGQYNNVQYKSRRWYFCKTDEKGEVLDRATDNFMISLCVEKATDLKSVYNAPRGDLIIYDEFIGKIYRPNWFVYFLDLIKTIARERRSVKIVCVANTIDRHSQWFHELMIHKDVMKMNTLDGESKMCTTPKGTKIWVNLIVNVKRRERKTATNMLYFGFDNPAIASITGGDWSVENYQHCESGIQAELTVLSRQFYIEHNDELIQLEICSHPKRELFINAHYANKTQDDSFIFTLEDTFDDSYIFKFGTTKVHSLIWDYLFRNNLFYYASNDVGEIVADYVKQAKYR